MDVPDDTPFRARELSFLQFPMLKLEKGVDTTVHQLHEWSAGAPCSSTPTPLVQFVIDAQGAKCRHRREVRFDSRRASRVCFLGIPDFENFSVGVVWRHSFTSFCMV